MEINPEEAECSGWIEVVSKKKKLAERCDPNAPTSAKGSGNGGARTAAPQKVLRRVVEAFRIASLPRNHFKTIVRPRGGLDVKKTDLIIFKRALAKAASLTAEQVFDDSLCTNPFQNILVVATPFEANARAYAKVQQICMASVVIEVTAYVAALNDACKGVIRGIISDAELMEMIVNRRNPGALGVRRIKKTTTVIELFDGHKVPLNVEGTKMSLETGEPPKLYGVNFQPLAPFDFANPPTWATWLSRYEDYAVVSGLTKASEDMQVRSLLYCMGPEARPLLETFSLDAQSLASYQAVATRFTEHFVHPANELYESSRFHRRVQLPDESVDTYYAEPRRMVKRCNYPSAAVEERLVRDRFVVGLRDSRLSDQLCRNAKLTPQDAWTQARQSEDADREKALPQNRTEHSRELNLDAAKASKFPSRRRSAAKPRSPQSLAERSREPSTCEFCGRAPHRRSDCPARRSTCNFCKKKGHFAEVWRSRKFKQYKLSSVHLHAVATPASAKFVDVTVDDYTAQFKVDSGAEVSAVPSDFPTLPATLDQVDTLLTGPGGQPLRVLGSYMARLQWQGKTSCQRLYVIQSLTVPLLGLPALQALQVVRFLDQLKTSKATLHAELFNGLGTLKDEYNIRLKPDAVPFSLSVPRRIPIPLLEIVRRELDKLESAGVIRRVDKPTPWCSGLVVVRKGDGSYRLCVDLTQLNKVVLRERHILPTVEQVLGLLGDATVFSKLDATASFHQVKLAEDSQELTTFITPYGRYCFCRLPFGITSAPEYFQKQMARILEGQEGVANMIDDILVFGRTRQEHDARLSQVLSRLAKAGITLNQDKCRFGVPEISFLGVVVSAQGIRPDPGKVEAVKAMEAPTDVAGVRRLLGMVNHLASTSKRQRSRKSRNS
ncbi:uncharacterized protein LOC142558304 [Dermacentor variabilis]|uniref:uncharacterized protein LOC142558304 n=1 Tax=Dermacentor variabilis TaxID=34621 RepID=UPI003F5B67B6